MNILNYIRKPANIFRFGRLSVRQFYHQISRLLRPCVYWPRRFESEKNGEPLLKICKKKGYCITGKFSLNKLVQNAICYASSQINRFHSDVGLKNCNKKDYLISIPYQEDDLNGPLLKLATSPDLVDIAADYLGFIPILSNIQIWHSPNKESGYKGSQLYHLDYADVSQCKLFIPIEEIDHDTGPLTFIAADLSDKIAKAVKYKLSEGEHRVSDSKVDEVIGMNQSIPAVGKPGEMVIVDTCRCFHYGSRKASKPRSLIMIQYVSPFAFMFSLDYSKEARFARLAQRNHSRKLRMLLGAA
jgi:hypothetical protein